MNILRSAAAAAILALSFPVQAQTGPAPIPQAPAKPSCPCDNYNFKPLNDKARAAAGYWDARRRYKIATTIAAGATLIALLSGDRRSLNEAEDAMSKAGAVMLAARTLAEKLGAVKVTGGDLDGVIEFKLQKDVDYTL